MHQWEEQQQQGDCMVEVDDPMEAGDGFRLKIQPAEVGHNVHDEHVGDLRARLGSVLNSCQICVASCEADFKFLCATS